VTLDDLHNHRPLVIGAQMATGLVFECLVPQHSKLPGVRRWAYEWQQGVVVNANTIETIAAQYNSLVLERSLVDPSVHDERFPQFFPSSELTARWTNPGTRPTFAHRQTTHPAGAHHG
jgi:hypothetical protein